MHEPLLTGRHASEPLHVSHGRCPKGTAILPTELRGAFIPDLKGHSRGIQPFRKHQSPRFVQPQPFLVLQWAHCHQYSKMMGEPSPQKVRMEQTHGFICLLDKGCDHEALDF